MQNQSLFMTMVPHEDIMEMADHPPAGEKFVCQAGSVVVSKNSSLMIIKC